MNDLRTKNILYVSHTADLRGSAMSLRELMTNLDAERFRAHALISKHGPLEGILTEAGIPFLVVSERGLLNLKRISYARKYIRDHRIDLVHLNSAVPFCRDIGIAARLEHIPVVWHIREDPNGKRVRRWSRWIRWLAKKIIVVSSDLEEHFRSSGKVVKVYNGINLDRFSPEGGDAGWRERLNIQPDDFVFILVGTIEERKGQHLAIEAAAGLIGNSRPFHILIVGSALGPDDQARLDASLNKHPQVAAITHCVGRQSDVAPLLRASDCLMLPSAWEGFPRTVAEGMACGLPIIATPVGEVPKMVEKDDGWIVSPGNAASLLEGMRHALESPNLGTISARAQKKAASWSVQAHVMQIQARYDEILHRRDDISRRRSTT